MLSAFILSMGSYSAMLLAEQLIYRCHVHPGPLVLRTGPFRFEPSSRTTLIGEQPNPWKVLPLQDVMSRHRGAKPFRRCELLETISLLSPG